jgi:hypothetical protein
MEDLIEALKIFAKYQRPNTYYPTCCSHDVLLIAEVKKDQVSPGDLQTLKDLSFSWDTQYNCFRSFRFGSA